jgi:hypothetical protein
MPIPDPPPGFVRGYHLTAFGHGISNIGLQRLKVARFSEVNDPFELFAFNVKNREARSLLTEFKVTLDTSHGILCSSKGWKNPVLWSHYATGGRGLALGFDIQKTIGAKGVIHIEYRNEKLNAFGKGEAPQITEELQQLLLATKFKHWEYEEECRALIELSATSRDGRLHFFPFGDQLRLCDVVLGPLCPPEVVTSVEALVGRTNPNVPVRTARLGYKWFEVKEEARRP